MRITILFLSVVLLTNCVVEETDSQSNHDSIEENYFQVTGHAQGTTYSIIYKDSLQRDLSQEFDSLLKDYDSYLSIYVDTSLISRFNNNMIRKGVPVFIENDSEVFVPKELFEECFKAAKSIYHNTDGAFDPSVYPLVKYWGFLDKDYLQESSQTEIDSILELVNFSDSSIYIRTDSNYYLGSTIREIWKKNVRSRIDFNGIAQGHSVDVLGRYLETLEIDNYMVEIGGEILCKGLNNKNTAWQIGIDKPVENSSPGSEGFQMILNMNNKAVATSGNYRKFYEKDGIKYSHTISPKTGYPVQHSLLSVTVVTDKCIDADGYATAFMVMGMEKTQQFIEENPTLDLEVYLITSSNNKKYDIWMSNGFEDLISE